ncbi:TlpA family protein disulfide reductase [Flavobacterium sp. HXWNR69]|uniref:TlpA family protein disulfide reductase n=1 Tax=Flavobacterium fragile TaxID=2949085 RepID=A0ABT0TFT7_9FLAO|nr:TlpA disulfide reductase family protein [Flavobacterium sp. HXWNR69]MCL9769844.1 TlpA family protein disulfide reductase [Flavobacterium sp. HXWNR69]
MKYFRLIVFSIFFLSFSIKAQNLITFQNFDELNAYVQNNSEIPLVVNFWATWCTPCVKELPYFQKLHQDNPNVKVITVSLDFEKQVESKLKPFLKKKNYTFVTTYMADKKFNNWISKVDENWSGSIPATWIIKANKGIFVEQEFASFEELNQFVNESLTKLN